MLLGGLWHGASWNFVIWGAIHGVSLAVQKVFTNKFPILKKNKFTEKRSVKIISILGTQYFVFMAWLAFRVEDFEALSYVLYKYIVWDFATDSTIHIISHNIIPLILIIGFFILNYVSYKRNVVKYMAEMKPIYWIGILITIMTLVLLLYDMSPEDFIYFRF